MGLAQAPLPLGAAMRLVLADVAPATLAACACASSDLWQTAKSVATARLGVLMVDAPALQSDKIPGEDVLFLLAAMERGGSDRPYGLMGTAAARELLQHALGWALPPAMSVGGRCVLHISVGAEHSLCTTTAGRLFSCGSGRHGRLGYRPDHPHLWQQGFREVEFAAPVHVRRVFVVKADAGGRHSVALDSQGRAYTWGFGKRGRLGHGDGRTYYAPHCVEFDRGSTEGEPATGPADKPAVSEEQKAPGPVLVDVSAGGAHTLFVTATGDAYSCGIGGDGRLGLGHRGRALRPAHIRSLSLAGVRVVACAAGGGPNEGREQREYGAHSVFLASDGTCWSCGCVGNGRLGMRSRIFSRKGYGAFSRTCYSWSSPLSSIDQMIPAKMAAWVAPSAAAPDAKPPPRVRQVVAGERSTLLLCEDGSLISFGMSLRGRKTACTAATEKFFKTFEGVDRVEGLGGDLHGVPPHCLVPYGGQPEEPFDERPTLPSGADSSKPDGGTAETAAKNCEAGRAAEGQHGGQMMSVAVFEARGWLFVRKEQRGAHPGHGSLLPALWWRKREGAGSPEWELLELPQSSH